MTPTEFEQRVQQMLDRRRDPLADRQCAEFLAEHPEAVASTARLLERCAALPASPRAAVAQAAARRRWPVLTAATVAAACAVALVATRSEECAASARRSIGCVLSASLEPILPRLQEAPTVRLRSVLLAEPGAEFEVFNQWGAR